jgi:hypothetical protein
MPVLDQFRDDIEFGSAPHCLPHRGAKFSPAPQSQARPPYEFACAAVPADLTEDELRRRDGSENVVRENIVCFDDGP